MVSVGTGQERTHFPDKGAAQINLKDQFQFVIPALLGAVSVQQDTLCRVLGDCLFGEEIDREVGALTSATLLPPGEQKFTYVRYNRDLDTEVSGAPGQRPLDPSLDRVENMPVFQRVGREYAAANVKAEHLVPRAAAG